MISTDGYKKDGEKVLADKATVIELTKKMLQDGGRGIELLNLHRNYEIREPHEGSPYYSFDYGIKWQTMKAVVNEYRAWRDK